MALLRHDKTQSLYLYFAIYRDLFIYYIVDGEKDKHMDNREDQTAMDTGVEGAKGCIKLLWARGESSRDGR